MYFWMIKKIARAYVDILSIASVMAEEDRIKLLKIKKKAQDAMRNQADNN